MTMARKQLQVLQSIIASIRINMMNPFTLFKKSPKLALHYKVMFSYITISICIGMVRFVNKSITSHFYSPTFPTPSLFTLWHIKVGAFMTTIFRFRTWFPFLFKWLTTSLTNITQPIWVFPPRMSLFGGISTLEYFFTFKGAGNSLLESRLMLWSWFATNNTRRNRFLISYADGGQKTVIAVIRACASRVILMKVSLREFLATYFANHIIIIPYLTNNVKGVGL